MSLNGKREGFQREDLLALAQTAGIKKGRAADMIQQVKAAGQRWPDFAELAGIPESRMQEISKRHRLAI